MHARKVQKFELLVLTPPVELLLLLKKSKIFKLIALSIIVIVFFSVSGKLFEDVDAGEIVVIQDPFDGELHVYTQPGVELQMFGRSTHYRKSFQLPDGLHA